MQVEGSCHCGRITYRAEVDPERVTICHCTDCQTLSGSPYRSSVPAPAASFRFLSGKPRIYVKTAESGARRNHAFCPDCGSPVYSSAAQDDPPFYSVRVGCLEQRAQLPARKRIWCRSALGAYDDLRALPKVDRQ